MIRRSNLTYGNANNMLPTFFRRFRPQTDRKPRPARDARIDHRTTPQFKFELQRENNIRNIVYWPDFLTFEQLDYKRSHTIGKRFENVSFSHTTIVGIDFGECVFIDCDLINTTFVNCEFHDCTFQNCDPYKISFVNTYIDPQVFVGMLDKHDQSNKGLELFQVLYDNATNTNQYEYASTAEFNKRKWQRYQLTYDHTNDRIKTMFPGFTYRRKWFINVFSWLTFGYGIRSKFLSLWIAPIAFALLAINYVYWDCLQVSGTTEGAIPGNLTNVIFYTLTSHVGVNIFAPASLAGKLLLVFQSGFGLVTIAVALRMFVRLALK